MKAINTYLKIIGLLFIFSSANLLAQWEQCNIPFFGKAVSDLVFKGDTIIAGGNGVFLSTNNGASWKKSSLKSYISKVFIKGDNILASTGQTGGLYLSSNNGNSWKNLGQTYKSISSFFDTGKNIITGSDYGSYISADEGYSWQVIEYNKAYNSYIHFNYFADCQNKILAGNYAGASQSTDYGYSWSNYKITDDNLSISMLAKEGDNIYARTDQKGIFKSTDNGNNWVSIMNGLPIDIKISKIEVIENKVFMLDYNNGLYLSIDGGKKWSVVGKEIPDIYIKNIAISGNNLLVGTSQHGLYRSSDYGATWSKSKLHIAEFYVDFEITKFYINGSKIFTSSNYGLLSSENNGENWTLSRFNVPNITYVATNNTSIVALSGDTGYLSTNNGDSWSQLSIKFNSYTNPVIDSDTLYIAKGGRVLFSTDNGKSWNNDGTDPDSISNTISAFAICEGRILASKKDGVYISKDKGLTWDISNKGLENNIISNYGVYTHFIFAATHNGLYLSKDYGSNWEMANNGLPLAEIKCIAISENNLFVGTYGQGVWISKDFGNSWEEINKGLEDNIINNIGVNGNLVFVATSKKGLFVSSDYGSSWKNANDGLDTTVNCVAINKDFVFAGTNGNSLLKSNIKLFSNTLSVSSKQLTISATTNSTQTFDIASDTSWTIDNDASWLNVSQSSGFGTEKITLTAQENSLIKPRNAIITIKCPNDLRKTVFVSQEGAARYLKVSSDTFKLDSPDSTTLHFDIISNTSWEIEKNEDYPLKANLRGGIGNASISLIVQKNTVVETQEYQLRISGSTFQAKIIYVIQKGVAPFLNGPKDMQNIGDSLDSWQAISINSNTKWKVQIDQNWLVTENLNGKFNGSIYLRAFEENTKNTARSANVTVTADGTPPITIIVTQDASANKLWKSCNGPNSYYGMLRSIATNGDKVYIGANKIFLSSDTGISWITDSLGNGYAINCLAINDNNIFACIENTGIYLTTNNGNKWDCISKNIPNTSIGNVSVIRDKIFASNIHNGLPVYGFYLSSNNGAKWKKIENGLLNVFVYSFAECENNIFASTNEGIFISTDEGETWVKDGLVTASIFCLTVNGNDIFAGTYSGEILHRQYISSKWELVSVYGGQYYNPITCLANSGKYIFVATESEGIFLSTNNGKSWTSANNGLMSKQIWGLSISGNNIYAITNYRTVFKANLSDFNLGAEDLSEKSQAELTIYPNPAQNSLNIRLGEVSALSSSVRVLDVCGRIVAESQIIAGTKELTLDLKELPVGIYLLNVISGNSIKSQKFAVCR